MNRITGKARDETLIELQSTTDTHTGGNSIKEKEKEKKKTQRQSVRSGGGLLMWHAGGLLIIGGLVEGELAAGGRGGPIASLEMH